MDINYCSLEDHNLESIHKSYIVLSDSLFTLMSFKNTYKTSNIAKLIQRKISQSNKIEIKIKISLIWVLGHSDIEGNIKADQEAKKTVESTDTLKLNITTLVDIKN